VRDRSPASLQTSKFLGISSNSADRDLRVRICIRSYNKDLV